MRIAAGVLLASVASLLFNCATILQAGEARAVSSEHALRASLLAKLLQRRRWVAGTALQVLGVALQTGALLLAPLTVTQPADAVGLGLLMFLAWWRLGERVGRSEISGLLLIIVGVAGIAIVAPDRKVADFEALGVWLSVAGLAMLSLMPYLLRGRYGPASWFTVIGAGMAFALTAFCIKLLADALDMQRWAVMVIVAAISALAALVGTLSEQSALQQRQATQVAPTIFVIELIVPVALGVTVIGESWSRSPIVITVCLLAVSVGTVILGRTPTIAQLAARPAQ